LFLCVTGVAKTDPHLFVLVTASTEEMLTR
jgi:hypothetical protein